jgi:hypothetical protein
MIYLTPAVALATSPAGANAPWIGYQSVITAGNVSADEEAATFSVSNVATTNTAEKWKGTSTAPQTVNVAEGGTQSCNYVGIAKHNFGSTGATIKLQTSPDNSVWTDVVDEIAPATDFAIVLRFDPTVANFWRLYITPGSAAPSMAIMYLGTLLILPRNIYVGHSPFTLARAQQVTTGRSDSGAFLGRTLRREFRATSVKLENLDPTWYRNYFDPFAEASAPRPFFWAWRPGSYPDEVGYVWTKGSGIVPNNQRNNGMMQVSFDIEGVR